MRFIIYLLIGFFSSNLVLNAQNKNTDKTYKFVYTGYIDLDNFFKTPNRIGILLVKNDQSVFWHEKLEGIKLNSNDSLKILQSKSGKSLLTYKNYKKGASIFEYNSGFLTGKSNIFSDTLCPMQWTLTNSEKTINSKTCLKALTIFRGRAYAAWYDPEIKINDGPWKFCGLPGLIVEVYDEEKSMYWKLTALQTTTDELPIAPIPRGNYTVFKKEFNQNVKKYIMASMAESKLDPSCITCAEDTKLKIKTIENIVE